MPQIKYDIVKELGKLSTMESGWSKEINLVSWNEREPIYDIRTWNKEHDKMGKGVTLTASELKKLIELIENEDI